MLVSRLWTALLTLLFVSTLVRAQESVVLSTISILGAEKTKDWVILRELTFVRGDTLLRDQLEGILDRSRQNVYNLGLFNEVEMEQIQIEDQLHLIIKVKERWYLLGYPILRFEERNTFDIIQAIRQTNFRRLVYGAALQWRNFTGRNETLTLTGQLGFSKRFAVDLLRPALFRKANTDFRIGFRYSNEKEIIIGTDAGRVQWKAIEQEPFRISHEAYLGLRKRISIYQNLYAEISFKNILFSDSLYAINPGGEQLRLISRTDGRAWYPGFILQYSEDRRDLKSFPLKGFKYQLFFRRAGLKGLSSNQFSKLGATWAHHLPISEKWNFAYGFHHIYTFGDTIPWFEKNFIGFNRSEFTGLSTNLRGYEPYVIDGTYLGMNKLEIKYALIPYQIIHLDYVSLPKFQDVPVGLYLSGFLDTAYISDKSFNNQDKTFKNKWLIGYGIGLNVIGIYDLLLRIEYARNHLGQGGIFLNGSVSIK